MSCGAMPSRPALVIDASAMVHLLLAPSGATAISSAMSTHRSHVPAHFDAEVLSALGRLNRAGELDDTAVSVRLDHLGDLPLQREPLAPLLSGAWQRRHGVRLVDAIYLALAERLDAVVMTTDERLVRAAQGLARLPQDF